MIAPFVLLLLLAGLATAVDLTKLLGAHPWWSASVLWIGAAVGSVLYASATALNARTGIMILTFSILTLAGFAIATWGKARFAASFAEDAVAGQMWYFGWIATCAFVAAALISLLRYWQQNR